MTDSSAKKAAKANTDSVLNQKWGALVINVGYTVVPSVIIQAQRRLHLTAIQFNVLLHLLDMWWQASDMPWPTKRKIADRMGVKEKTVQRAIVAMEQEGLLLRVNRWTQQGGRTSNRYDLSPLAKRLEEIAVEMLEASKIAQLAKEKVRKPGLRKPKK